MTAGQRWNRREGRGKRRVMGNGLHTRNRHLRNRCGFSVASCNGFSLAFSTGCYLFSDMFPKGLSLSQWISTAFSNGRSVAFSDVPVCDFNGIFRWMFLFVSSGVQSLALTGDDFSSSIVSMRHAWRACMHTWTVRGSTARAEAQCADGRSRSSSAAAAQMTDCLAPPEPSTAGARWSRPPLARPASAPPPRLRIRPPCFAAVPNHARGRVGAAGSCGCGGPRAASPRLRRRLLRPPLLVTGARKRPSVDYRYSTGARMFRPCQEMRPAC